MKINVVQNFRSIQNTNSLISAI